jgi:hypothetical protein
MKRILFGIIIGVVVLFSFKYCDDKRKSETLIEEQSHLIQQQVKSVNKIIVTEGHFSEVFTYKDSKEIFNEYFKADKKALVVVNAEVTVAYDLSKITYEIDEDRKVLNIKSIPQEEIKINPDIEYYDIQSDYLNPFEASDYNAIKNEVKASLRKKFEQSDLKTNSKNRLISELAKFYILTNSMGWILEYNENPVEDLSTFEKLNFLN